VVETVLGDEDRIEMARPCCIISTGSGLEKMMRTGNDGAVGYHMDAEMALTEASFLAPDDDTKASYLLHTTADEEEERKALSKQMRVHDQMHILVDRPQRQKSLVHCDPTNRQALDTQDISISDYIDSSGLKSTNIFQGVPCIDFDHPFELIGEDDDLLCDFAPQALQADGSVGLMAEDGSIVQLPQMKPTESYWTTSHGVTIEHQRTIMLGRARLMDSQELKGAGKVGCTGFREPCLSDSWHAQSKSAVTTLHPADSSESSITALRQRYQRAFGKETSSNNRQWLLRRLAEINAFTGDTNAGDDLSGNGCDPEGIFLREGCSPGSAVGTNELACSEDWNRGVKKYRAVKRVTSKQITPLGSSVGDRSGRLAKVVSKGVFSIKRCRDVDSLSAENEAAKTDGSAADKKLKRGHHSDSESAGEPPVRSRNSIGGCDRKINQTRKSIDNGNSTSAGNGRRSKHHNPWALEEAEALVEGVARCGGGKWADIKKLGFAAIEHRTAVDLKDKWRNLLRIAMLPQQPVKTAGDKKREIPSELLARVRDLAAKQVKKQAQDARGKHGR